jgi:agmatine deiminase
MNRTPRDLGFSMPPEWAAHDAVWTAWPDDDEEWLGHLEAVREEFAVFVRTLARFERVELVVRSEGTEADARRRLEGCGNLQFHRVKHNDVWFRDCAPIFVTRDAASGRSELAAVDWVFNGWGGKFDATLDDQIPAFVAGVVGAKRFEPGVVMEGGALEVNGEGVLLTTKQCLLEKHRNPDLSMADLERVLGAYLGVQKVLWLEDGLENDHTDGHVDTITRFASENVIVTSVCEDEDDPNHVVLKRNLELLRGFTDTDGQPFEIVTVPLPKHRLEHTGEVAARQGVIGERLPPTYANFYIGNGCVIVPVYGDDNDARALEILQPLFPGREVIGLSSRALINGGGSFHCVTQQQPSGRMWQGE